MTDRDVVEILLVEDNPEDAELTIRQLKKQHLVNTVHHAKDGAEALDYVFGTGTHSGRNVENGPKVILLDLKLPKVSGLEVLKKIKADERTKKIPVVVVTSSREDRDLKACYELGVNSYIVKPVDFDAFAKVTSELGMYWVLVNTTVV